MNFAAMFHVQTAGNISPLFFSWGIRTSVLFLHRRPLSLLSAGRGLVHLFIFIFCHIRLLFHKDLGPSGELSGLGVFERNVEVHAHSHGHH